MSVTVGSAHPKPPLGASSYANLRPALFFPLTDTAVDYALVRDFAYPLDHDLHRDIPPNLHINDHSDDDDNANSNMFDDDYSHQSVDANGFGSSQLPWTPRQAGGFPLQSNGNSIERLPNFTFNSESVPIDGSYDTSHFGLSTDHSQANGPAEGAPQFEEGTEDDGRRQPAVALYDFEQENDNELPLQEGQIIHICYPHGQGWLVAQELPSGRTGLVPENYVRLLEHVEGGAEALGLDQQLYLPETGAEEGPDAPTSTETATSGSVGGKKDGLSTGELSGGKEEHKVAPGSQ